MVKMLSLLCCAAVVLAGCDAVKSRFSGPKTTFDGNAALAYAKAQVDIGPRIPGTPAHDKAADWIVAEMKKRTDSVTVQSWTQTTRNGTKLPLKNILARFNPTATSRVLYVTHWDTRPVADDDPNFGNKARRIRRRERRRVRRRSVHRAGRRVQEDAAVDRRRPPLRRRRGLGRLRRPTAAERSGRTRCSARSTSPTIRRRRLPAALRRAVRHDRRRGPSVLAGRVVGSGRA